MKKKYVKFAAAVMTAVMVMAAPITASAHELPEVQTIFDTAPSGEPVNGLAQAGVKYTLNGMEAEGVDDEPFRSKSDVMFLNVDASLINQKHDGVLSYYDKPDYEWRCIYIVETRHPNSSCWFTDISGTVQAQSIGTSWDEYFFTGELEYFSEYAIDENLVKYTNSLEITSNGARAWGQKFSVNHNGAVYADCQMLRLLTDLYSDTNGAFDGEYVCFQIPKGYDGELRASFQYLSSNVPDDLLDRVDYGSYWITFECNISQGVSQPSVPTETLPAADTTQTPAADITQTPAADTTQTPAADITQTPAADITQTPAADTTQTPAADTLQESATAQATEQSASETEISYAGTTYITKAGDSLVKIAKEKYNDKNMWRSIYELNKNIIKNPNAIYANMQLLLP